MTGAKHPRLRKAALIVILVLAVLAAAWAAQYFSRSPASAAKQFDTDSPFIYDTTKVSAHRCGGGLWPENTMMAVEGCMENGAFTPDILEFDIHMTADGVPVVLHDDTLDRTSDCEAVFGRTDVRPEDCTYEELRQLNMGAKFTDADGNMPYAGLTGSAVPDDLRIMTVDELVDYVTARSDTTQFILEVKSEGQPGHDCVDYIYELITSRGLTDRCIFATFLPELSDYADENYPELYRGANMGEVVSFWFAALTNKQDFTANYDVLQLPYGSIADSYGVNLGTARIVNYAHAHNIAVQYWTVDREKDIAYLRSIGADAVTTNRPDLAAGILGN